MNLKDVMAELGERLDTIDGLRVFPYSADQVHPPAAMVGLPDSITFDETYGRGSDAMSLPVFVLVGKVSDRASHAEISAYANGSGVKSIKSTLDNSNTDPYTSCDTVTVKSVEFNVFTSAGVELLGAQFKVDITGSGS